MTFDFEAVKKISNKRGRKSKKDNELIAQYKQYIEEHGIEDTIFNVKKELKKRGRKSRGGKFVISEQNKKLSIQQNRETILKNQNKKRPNIIIQLICQDDDESNTNTELSTTNNINHKSNTNTNTNTNNETNIEGITSTDTQNYTLLTQTYMNAKPFEDNTPFSDGFGSAYILKDSTSTQNASSSNTGIDTNTNTTNVNHNHNNAMRGMSGTNGNVVTFDSEHNKIIIDKNILHNKLVALQKMLHTNNVPDKQSSCFWCTCGFDNPPIYIPKELSNGIYEVYGCFCSPECASAYLFNEDIEIHTINNRYTMLNNMYKCIYNYTDSIKRAPSPFYILDKYYGNISIEEYRTLYCTNKILLVVDKPLTRVLPELHSDNSLSFNSGNTLSNTNDNNTFDNDDGKIYKLSRNKPLKNKNSMNKFVN